MGYVGRVHLLAGDSRRVKAMIEIVKTYSGVPRVRQGWGGVVEQKARVTISYLYRCKVCGRLFTDKAKAKEHSHEETK